MKAVIFDEDRFIPISIVELRSHHLELLDAGMMHLRFRRRMEPMLNWPVSDEIMDSISTSIVDVRFERISRFKDKYGIERQWVWVGYVNYEDGIDLQSVFLDGQLYEVANYGGNRSKNHRDGS